ncbi:MAG: sulfotransferase domain-containing protein [Caldilineaceae bacterium]|nr:sulfotransferase domain-containing protein [Caldilineaceae bacterium]
MTLQLPQVTHIYQNNNLDSTRWQHFQPRADDIVITTSIKSGTTWMQEIVRQLIFSGQESAPERDHVAVWDVSPWLEWRMIPCEAILERLNAQQHRRFIKSHLPLDGLPFFPQVKYIVVGRDARDVAMSLWNHYAEFTEGVFAGTNSLPERIGDPMPHPPSDIHAFWQDWISRGWFAWECEGYPFWGNLHHTQTWWQYRHLPNILFVHYNDLKADLAGEIRRIADFLAIPLTDDALPAILPAVTLDAMRNREGRLNEGMAMSWKEGAKTFFFKGTNGRWQDVLSAEELQLYDEKAAQVLTPDCRAWLERGRVALRDGR